MKSQIPTATMQIGKHKLLLETRRVKFDTRREVRSSDTGDHGKGTLLGIDQRTCRMMIHEVRIVGNGDQILLRVTQSGQRTSCTKTMARGLKDIDGKAIPEKQESYSIRQATALLSRMLKITEQVAAEILAPLPEMVEVMEKAETAEAIA